MSYRDNRRATGALASKAATCAVLFACAVATQQSVAATAATPTLKPAPGTYKAEQTVTLSDSTAGAVIYFTINGSVPTIHSTKYTAAFKIIATTTVKAIAVKTGDTTSAEAVGTYTITSPSGLSYPATPPLLIGKAVSLVPKVTGTGLTYSVRPALPAGVSLHATSGVIGGTPTKVTAPATYTVTATNSSGSTSDVLSLRVDLGPTVHVIATASDAHSTSLTYQWKTTDGTLLHVNGSQTDWELPPGPGLHFAYVLVSNGKGGYTERRIVVSTDSIGNPMIVPPPSPYVAPAANAPVTVPVRGLMQFGQTVGTLPRTIMSPGAGASIVDSTGTISIPPLGLFDSANYRGETVFEVPLGIDISHENGTCTLDSGVISFACLMPNADSTGPFAVSYAFTGYFGASGLADRFTGTALLSDGSPCGTANEFFGVQSAATVELLDASNTVLAGPNDADAYGGYVIPSASGAVSVRLTCEAATPVVLPVSHALADTFGDHYLGVTHFANPPPPTVSAITATFDGSVIAKFPSGLAPGPLPSDNVPFADKFLGEKGIDSRLGACQYYRAIGAVKSCDSAGKPTGAISFQDWKRTVRIDSFAPTGAPPTYAATYINKVDLNLTRVHHSISYGANKTAAYVCNHLGPAVLDPSQSTDAPNNPSIDTVINNTVEGKNLVACVAMDYFVSPGVNGNQPFTRFLIFGPSGQLLPSVNLDGRREKFVPGTCVVCHGGDFYAGAYPANGTGRADVGGHFLPYDTGNFEYSSKAGLTEHTQELAIYHLNQNLRNTGLNVATSELITGWYAGGSTTLNKNYVPVSWRSHGAVAVGFYQNVVARSCRTCHVAMIEAYDFEHFPMGGLSPAPGIIAAPDADISQTTCGPSLSNGFTNFYDIFRSHSMPNSLVTFNRFWESANAHSPPVPNQPALTVAFVQSISIIGPLPDCTLKPPPN